MPRTRAQRASTRSKNILDADAEVVDLTEQAPRAKPAPAKKKRARAPSAENGEVAKSKSKSGKANAKDKRVAASEVLISPSMKSIKRASPTSSSSASKRRKSPAPQSSSCAIDQDFAALFSGVSASSVPSS